MARTTTSIESGEELVLDDAKAPPKAARAKKLAADTSVEGSDDVAPETATSDEASPTKASAAKSSPAKATPAKASPAKATPAKAVAKKSSGLGALAPQRVPAKATGGYTTDEAFLASQRELLLQERATYVEQASLLKAEAESLVEEMEPGDIQFDEESGEGGTVTVDRERDLALSAQALAAVEEIDDALLKMERGTYGVCESCGELIPAARLEALPYARLCVACKSGGLSRR